MMTIIVNSDNNDNNANNAYKTHTHTHIYIYNIQCVPFKHALTMNDAWDTVWLINDG